MKKLKVFLVVFMLLLDVCLQTGCWNYREIDEMAIVAGVAIDKGKEKRFEVTAEIVQIPAGKESQMQSLLITEEGDTMFDAVRNLIPKAGIKLYWSHAKTIIISQDIAKEGVVKILDWFNRDAETRADYRILISREKTAKEILEAEGAAKKIKSYVMDDSLMNQKNLAKAPQIEIWEIVSDISAEGVSAIAPAVFTGRLNGKEVPVVLGTAVFSKDRLAGFLDEEDTKTLLFIKDEITGGILVQEAEGKEGKVRISLEIFGNKTKIKPVIKGKNIEMEINIDLAVAIDEIQGTEDFMEEKQIEKLEKDTAEHLKKRIADLVEKVQKEFDADIFGFGSKINADDPKEWKRLSKDWKDIFKQVTVIVKPKVHVDNSAMLAEPLKMGD